MVLRARDAGGGTAFVLRRQDAVDDVDIRRHAELLASGVATRLELDRLAGDQQRRVHRGREAAERRDEIARLDAFGRLRVRGRLLRVGRRGECHRHRQHETERELVGHVQPPDAV